jgi:hypothetical protein
MSALPVPVPEIFVVADLFFVVETLEPAGEFVGALNIPRHTLNMPFDALCVKSYTFAAQTIICKNVRPLERGVDELKAQESRLRGAHTGQGMAAEATREATWEPCP